jgi:uroporphyrinogen decarboxylase
MTHRERVLRTFRFEETDRTPYDLMEGVVWAELLDYFRATQGCVEVSDVLDYLDTDCRWLWIVDTAAPAQQPQPAPRASSETTFSRHVAAGPLADAYTVSEIEAHAWPDPARWVAPDFAQARQRWPDHALVFLPGWKPLFWGACEAFGVEAALTNLIAAPALFEAAVRCIHDRYMDQLARGLQAARGYCDICWLGDDFSSQQAMLIRPEHWRRFIKPYLAEQVALARSHGLYVLYHSCGAVRPVLPDLIDIGVNGLLVFQTTARGMDAPSVARDFGGHLVFYGGMDVQRLLSFGNPAEVWAEVQANQRVFARCGGYIVANSHHRVATISGQNIEAMCRAARQDRLPPRP